MQYHVFATDFDGTLSHDGIVSEETIDALKRLADSGRKIVLVTGREMHSLKSTFPTLNYFHWIVAENGGVIFDTSSGNEIVLGDAPPKSFVDELVKRGVNGISVGQCVVATWTPYENIVLDTIRDLGLELNVVFNKGAVMVLPPEINKATGLQRVLMELGLSVHNTVGVGDAENDHAFLKVCEFSAATANALPSLKASVDLVLKKDHGAGVVELIDLVLEDDLWSCKTPKKEGLAIGVSENGPVLLPTYGDLMMICGASGGGKSTLANKIADVLTENVYQFCLVDPEGDFESLPGAIVLGGPNSAPQLGEIMHALEQPRSNVVVCLTGVSIPDRPEFFLRLLGGINQLRARSGRPHWLILDEAHHLMPVDWEPPAELLPAGWSNVIAITVSPDLLPLTVLNRVSIVTIVGADANETLKAFGAATNKTVPVLPTPDLTAGEVWQWDLVSILPIRFKALKSTREHTRHRRKYAEGQLAPEKSFYFTGPEGKLNLRAQNLILFCQIVEGIDDETWFYHLQRNDFAHWFRDCINDDKLADVAELAAMNSDLNSVATKTQIQDAIHRNYILLSSSKISVPGAM